MGILAAEIVTLHEKGGNMKKNTIMRCDSCGLTVETVSDQGCTQCVVCCTEPMEELEAKTADTKVEKHVPFPVEGENGLIVPSKNINALFEAMKQMLLDTSSRKKMANNARPLIHSRFEKGFVQDCLIQFYEEILN